MKIMSHGLIQPKSSDPPPLSFYTIIMTSLFYFLSEFYSKSWCKRSTEIIIYTVCLFYSTICCWTKREKLSVVWSVNYLPPIQNWVVSLRFEVQRNLGICRSVQPKVVLVIFGWVYLTSVKLARSAIGTVHMQRNRSFIPCPCCTIHTLISPSSTAIGHYGYVSDDIKVFKRGSQVIRIYCAICVVSASSSPVSRVISEPKEVRSFHEVGLPIWSITADGLVVIVKYDQLQTENVNFSW